MLSKGTRLIGDQQLACLTIRHDSGRRTEEGLTGKALGGALFED